MTLNAKIEYQLENAFVEVIGDTVAFSGVTVRRHTLASAAPTYPIITVYCSGAMDSPFTQLADYQEAVVNVNAYTYVKDDESGGAVAELLGNLRSLVYSSGFRQALSASDPGLNVWGIRANGQAIIEDGEDIRRRTLVLTVYASSVFIDSSSSDSSSSST
jgi:hypothetical protein